MPTPSHVIEFWDERYVKHATPWDRGGVSPALMEWLDSGVLETCRILVPGCGRGHEVVELARRGFEVVAVDVAPTAIDMLRRDLTQAQVDAQVICRDLLTWEPGQSFDAVYEQTCLCALAPPAWPAYADRLADWVRPGAQLHALFMQTGEPGGPPYHCELSRMRELFSDDRWSWPLVPPVPIPHPAGIQELGYVLVRNQP